MLDANVASRTPHSLRFYCRSYKLIMCEMYSNNFCAMAFLLCSPSDMRSLCPNVTKCAD